MTSPPPRSGLRFTLRTLMVVVAITACYLGYEVNIVRQRKAALHEFSSKPSVRVVTAEEYSKWAVVSQPPAVPKLRWISRMMGDTAIHEVIIHTNVNGYDPADRVKAKWIFPEANVVEQEVLFEPCHPGCFPKGTLVDTPTGRKAIETIVVGDLVVSVRSDGTTESLPVQSIFKTENRLWLVETDVGSLVTTETQPLRMADGTTKGAGDLLAGDIVLRFDGAQTYKATVQSASKTKRIDAVINLVLGDRQAFVAGGFVVRSKPSSDH